MVNFCCVRGCGHRSNRDKEIRFFRIPSVPKRADSVQRNLIARQRREWLRQIYRKDITETSTKPWHRVCSSHFLSGKPADLQACTDPDWTPSVNLGHQMGSKLKVETYQRLTQRNHRKMETCQEHIASNDHLDLECRHESAGAPSLVEDDHTITVDKVTQTDMTASYISQLEDVVNHYTTENVTLHEKINETKIHSEGFYNQKPDRIKFYTGLPNMVILMALIKMISKNLQDNSLSVFQQVVLTLIRLRLNVSFDLLADMFCVSRSTVCRTFHNVLDVLYVQLQPLLHWPDRENIKKSMPPAFLQHFGRRVTVIIDCFELRLNRASNLQARNQTYSNYKHGNTVKFLIGITPQGMVSFISKAWGGRTSDKHITEQSGFLDNLQVGDLVLADRGFNIHESAGLRSAEVKTPAFTRGKKQLSAFEVEATRKLANVRIHVERVIGTIRQKYTVLDSTLPLAFMNCADDDATVLDKTVFVCCALVNLCPSVVLSDNDSETDILESIAQPICDTELNTDISDISAVPAVVN